MAEPIFETLVSKLTAQEHLVAIARLSAWKEVLSHAYIVVKLSIAGCHLSSLTPRFGSQRDEAQRILQLA